MCSTFHWCVPWGTVMKEEEKNFFYFNLILNWEEYMSLCNKTFFTTKLRRTNRGEDKMWWNVMYILTSYLVRSGPMFTQLSDFVIVLSTTSSTTWYRQKCTGDEDICKIDNISFDRLCYVSLIPFNFNFNFNFLLFFIYCRSHVNQYP